MPEEAVPGVNISQHPPARPGPAMLGVGTASTVPGPPCWVWAPACARSRHAGCGPGQHVPAHMAAAANGRAGGAALCGSRRGRQSAGSRGAGPGGLRPGSRRCRAERRERGSLGRDKSGPEAAPGQGRWSSPAERG